VLISNQTIRFNSKQSQEFSILHKMQTVSEAHTAQWVSGAFSPDVKRPGREGDHSSPSRAEVNHGGAVPPFPYMSLWRGALLIKHKDNFTFLSLTLHRTPADMIVTLFRVKF
jgi:hypothetical protein